MKKVWIIIFISICSFASGVLALDKVDINTATLQQLDKIVHVGLTIAQRIIDDRPYSSVQDLSRVRGIGNGKYLQDIISQGIACVNCQTQQTTQDTTNTSATTTDPTTATNEPTVTTPAITYPSGVFINEILPNPKGPDGTDEWIELYNSNNFDVDLSGWQLQDKIGTITTYTIPQNTTILADGFLVFKRPDTQIMLNNDGDGLNLLAPDGKIIDSIGFMTAPLGQSYNRTTNDWTWSTTLTPGATNIITVTIATSAAKALPTPKNSVKNDGVARGLADLSQSVNLNQDNNTTNPWFLFFIVLATTTILATIVLIIKLKFYKTNVRT